MILCLFPWPLKSHLVLPDGVGFFAHHAGRDVMVTCEAREGARIFSYTGPQCEWLNPGYEGFRTEISVSVAASVELRPYRHIYFRGQDPWVDATVDLVRYTRLAVIFEIESTDVLDDETSFQALELWVASVVQRFVDMYRLVTQEIDVVRPHPEDLALVYVWVADHYTFNPHEAVAGYRLHRPRFRWTSPAARGHDKEPVSNDAMTQIGKLFRSEYQIPLSAQLLVDAKERAHTDGQYDVSIVLVATAFEAFLRECLAATCEAQGRSTMPVRVGKTTLDRDYKAAIAEGDLRRDLLEYVNHLGANSAKGGREYTRWYHDAQEVRHRILHRGERGFSMQNFEAAFEAAIAYMRIICRNLQCPYRV
jgi:hypothetical protein